MAPKRALIWVAGWFLSAMLFAAGLFHFQGRQLGLEFLTCYIIEWTLSVDNLFVFLLIFEAFGVDSRKQLRALRWGIIGAIVMRLGFILIGVALVQLFEPILYAFGAILLYSAYKMAFKGDEQVDVRHNQFVLLVQKYLPVTDGFIGDSFVVRRPGGLMATPMLLVLVAIESSDLVFAIDSIPAAFAISRHPLVIFSANIFAILGLRSLYFLLAHADRMFRFLRYGVAVVLAFVGLKMLVAHFFKVNIYASLALVVGMLLLSILASLLIKERTKNEG